MTNFEKYTNKLENQDLKEYLKYLSEDELAKMEYHFDNYAKQSGTPADRERTLTIPDIRNKMTPITHLISLIEIGELDMAKESLKQAKVSVSYLIQRDEYPQNNKK